MKNPRIFLALVTLIGLLGLAPVWYQLQSGRFSRYPMIEAPATTRETVATPTTTQAQPIVNNQRVASVTEPKKSPRVLQDEALEPAAQAIGPQTRAALNSFQTKAELLTSRLNPELEYQLSRDASDSSNDQ
jgi:hypothetical protein